jgi:DnaJ-class molecular chaperone
MALVEGEYEFTCTECDGEGSLFTSVEAEGPSWVTCDDCRGEGTVCVDEEEAAEFIEVGHAPIRTPASA